MSVLIALVIGLTIWIVGWALGGKAFDWFMLTVAIVVVTATVRSVAPYLPGRSAPEE